MVKYNIKNVDAEIERLNRELGNPEKPAWNYIGGYQRSSAYGGHQLHQVCTTGGGVHAITTGYVRTTEFYNLIRYMDGKAENMVK